MHDSAAAATTSPGASDDLQLPREHRSRRRAQRPEGAERRPDEKLFASLHPMLEFDIISVHEYWERVLGQGGQHLIDDPRFMAGFINGTSRWGPGRATAGGR